MEAWRQETDFDCKETHGFGDEGMRRVTVGNWLGLAIALLDKTNDLLR